MKLTDTLAAILGGKNSVTVGHFVIDGTGERVPFGLKFSRQLGAKPSYNGRTGKGGGFDECRWQLGDLLKHELGTALKPDVALVIAGREYRAAEINSWKFTWEE